MTCKSVSLALKDLLLWKNFYKYPRSAMPDGKTYTHLVPLAWFCPEYFHIAAKKALKNVRHFSFNFVFHKKLHVKRNVQNYLQILKKN